MALLGGGVGGAGNPVGGTAGTSRSLVTIGDHIYATSGIVSVDGTETDMINSETGNFYCTMKVTFGSGVIVDNSDDFTYRIRFNDIIIWQNTQDHSDAHYAQPGSLHIIIPPFTIVRFTAENTTDNSSHDQIVIGSGRIYA